VAWRPAAPIGERNLPAILHVHGGGQTVDPVWLRFWTRRGYAALTFDWGGRRPGRDHSAEWGPLKQGNQIRQNATPAPPTPRINTWYLWTRISRRAVTYLRQQEEVDPDRIGTLGISMGGTLMWNLAVENPNPFSRHWRDVRSLEVRRAEGKAYEIVVAGFRWE